MTARASRRTQSRRSIATWSLRLRPVCSFAPAGAGELGDPALDRGVDVLVGRREHERARRSSSASTWSSAAAIANRSASVSRPDRRQHVDVGAGAVEVVGREPLVERQAHAQRHRARRPARRRTARARAVGRSVARHRPDPASGSRRRGGTAGSSMRWRRDHVSTERPQSRTKPAASSCRNASSAS